MKYLLGTGNYKVSDDWKRVWMQNAPDVPPTARATLTNAQPEPLFEQNNICVGGNLGHVGDLINGTKPYEMCGWSASVLALAMIAYNAELDFLYKEQDCLAFGPWVAQMYSDMGNGDFVFGRKMNSAPWMPCAQSLFLVRHRFIPTFVHDYIAQGKEGKDNLSEHKFFGIETRHPAQCRRMSFGYDRERPLVYSDRVWYAQKFTAEEIGNLQKRGLI